MKDYNNHVDKLKWYENIKFDVSNLRSGSDIINYIGDYFIYIERFHDGSFRYTIGKVYNEYQVFLTPVTIDGGHEYISIDSFEDISDVLNGMLHLKKIGKDDKIKSLTKKTIEFAKKNNLNEHQAFIKRKRFFRCYRANCNYCNK